MSLTELAFGLSLPVRSNDNNEASEDVSVTQSYRFTRGGRCHIFPKLFLKYSRTAFMATEVSYAQKSPL